MRYRLGSAFKVFNKGERGMVLPLVLIALLLMGLLIPPLMGLISTSLVTGKMYENSSYELYAADAGVMDATWFLQGLEIPGEGIMDPVDAETYFSDGTYTYIMPEEINGKTVTVEIVMDGSVFIITSTATGSDGSTTAIETKVQYPPPPPPIWAAVGALNGDLKISTNVGTESEGPEDPGWISIYANGNIYMIGGARVFGDAYYTEGHGIEQYPTSEDGIFAGTGIECSEMQLALDMIPDPPTTIWPGTRSISEGNPDLGDVYISGDLKITGDAQVHLTGTVWVAGKISIGSNSVVYGKDDDGRPYFMISEHSGSGDAISISGGTPDDYEFKVEAALYAPNGPIYVGGNASLDGSAVGESIDIQGTSRLTNPIPFEPVPPDYEPMEFNYWKIT